MAFGNKVGSIKSLKADVERGKSGTFIKYIPKNGSLNVRFLTEPDEWVSFREVFDDTRRKSYPVPDEGMPGYPDPDQRVSTRYLANVVLVDDDKVVPLQMPKDLVNQMIVRYEKHNTVMDRDYELFRSGEGLDTIYGLTPEAAMPRKMDKYTPHDLEKVLQDAYEAVWGASVLTKRDKKQPRKAEVTRGPLRRRRQVEEVSEPDEPDWDALATAADDEDDDDAINAIADHAEQVGVDPEEYDTWADVVAAFADADDTDDDEEETEEADEEEEYDEDEEAEEEDDDGDDLDADTLKGMPIGQVRAIARDRGIKTTGLKKGDLIRALTADVDEDEEEPF